MASLHSTLTGADLHEVKGAAGATANYVYAANGLGSASFVLPSTLQNLVLVNTISNSRSVDINPVVLDTPIDATFDGTVSNSDINMNASGVITFNTAGVYFTTFNLNFGRTAGAGTAVVAARLLLNGAQFGFTQVLRMDDAVNTRPAQFNIIRGYNAADQIKVEVMRDSSGINNGGLLSVPITPAGWGDVPSYWVRVSKWAGAI